MRRPDPLSAARIETLTHGNHAASHHADDLGWNDMGYDVDPVGAEERPGPDVKLRAAAGSALSPVADTPVEAAAEDMPVPTVVAPLADAMPVGPAGEPAPAAAVRAPRQRQAKAAFTLRLEPDRHLRLRLACAVSHLSAQQFVTRALDAFLATMPQLDALAEQARGDAAPKK